MRNLLTYMHDHLLGNVPELTLWDDRTAVEGVLHGCEATLWPEATLGGLADAINVLDGPQAVRINPFDLPTLVPPAAWEDAGALAVAVAEVSAGLPAVVYESTNDRVEYFCSDGPDWSTGEYAPDSPPRHLNTHQRGIVAVPTGALPKEP